MNPVSGFTVCGLKDRDAATGGRSRPKILEYNDAVLEWLGKDEGNLQKFYENPKDAFREATGVEDVDSLKSSCQEELSRNGITMSIPDLVLPPEITLRSQAVPVFADCTQGWDMVSAVTQKVLNDALGYFFKGKTFPYEAELKFKIMNTIDVDLSVSGEFGILNCAVDQGAI